MSLLHADFPSNDKGLYGDGISAMLNGLYAQADGALVDDPDPVIGAAGRVYRADATSVLRYVLPAVKNVVGIACRQWYNILPTLESRSAYLQWRTAANSPIVSVTTSTTGQLQVRAGDNVAAVVAQTPGPVVTANAWPHVEVKITQAGAAAAAVEIRVAGVVVLNQGGLTFANPGVSVGQVVVGGSANPVGVTAYYKDLVVWDNAGARNNDFFGSVTCFYRQTVATLAAGGWVPNANVAVNQVVTKPRLANVLTASGAIANGNQVRINNTYYNWTNGSVDAGAPAGTAANPWLVAMGASTAEALANLYTAINASGVAGVQYSTALTAHTTVTPFGLTDTTVAVIPTDGITVAMTFSETGVNTAWLSGAAFSYLVHDAIRASADYTPSVKATGTVTISGLPVANETVTINGQIYTFKAAAVGALEVTIGADANATGQNLALKINANSLVVTAANVAGVVTLTAIVGGTVGNAYTLAEAATNVVVSGATMAGGVNTVYPAPFEVSLEPLPDDVTSIRGVIPLVRAAKIDGGDGNIQVSFGVSVPSYSAGPDTPLSTAFTFWGNPSLPFVSEVNPATAAAWSPGEFNVGARMKVARTL